MRLNRQYEAEADELEHDAPKAAEAPILRRHVVLVFVEKLDLSAARAIQYARTLAPDELRAVHFALDPVEAEDLQAAWTRLGFSRLSLQVVDVPDRRLTRAALEVVAEALADGDTEVTVLLPRLEHNRIWHKLLHDRTADDIAEALSQLPHANVTFVPYHLQAKARNQVRVRRIPHSLGGGRRERGAPRRPPARLRPPRRDARRSPTCSSGSGRRLRRPGAVAAGAALVGCGVARSRVDGRTGGWRWCSWAAARWRASTSGPTSCVSGMVGEHGGRLAMLNPDYDIVPASAREHEGPPTSH